jgi:hypothetical protein
MGRVAHRFLPSARFSGGSIGGAIPPEMRLKDLEKRSKQLEREIALLDRMHSELDLIEADLPSSLTPPPTTAANSNDC